MLYGYEKVPGSIDIYFIHGYGRSMGTMQHRYNFRKQLAGIKVLTLTLTLSPRKPNVIQ